MAEYIVDTTDGIYNARTTGELVRCRDCMHMRTIAHTEVRYCDRNFGVVTDRDFCSHGDKREYEHGTD